MEHENEIKRITILKDIFYYSYLVCNVKSINLSVASTVLTFIGYSVNNEKYTVIAGILNISSLMLLLLSYFFEKQMRLKVDYINELKRVNLPYPSLA